MFLGIFYSCEWEEMLRDGKKISSGKKFSQTSSELSKTNVTNEKTRPFFLCCMYVSDLTFLLLNSGFSISLSVVQEDWWLEDKLACTRAQNRGFFGNLIMWKIRQCQANKNYERKPKYQYYKKTVLHLNEIKLMRAYWQK